MPRDGQSQSSAWRRHIGSLRRIVGHSGVLDSPVSLATYAYDATHLEGWADAVVLPSSTDQVAAVVRYCHEQALAVMPRGSGTDLSGGAVPFGGVVVAFSRLSRILTIDAANRFVVVQPGVINLELQKAVDPLGLMYAPDPASQNVCSLGGNVGKGAGGMRGLKYGVTRDHVLGLRVVLADGEVCEVGGPLEPVAPGLDWVGLLVGSEGTLTLVTEITLRLLPKPQAVRTLLAVFGRLEDAGDAASAVVARGIVPATLELMDAVMLTAIEEYARIGLPTDAGAILLIEVDGPPDGLEREAGVIEELCRRHRAREVRVAQSGAERDDLWRARRVAIGAAARIRPNYDLEDVTVPRGSLTAMLRQIADVGASHRVQIGILAHAGDGNLHPLILFDDRDEEEQERVRQARHEIFRRGLALGGTLSGEHGIGILKKEFMPWLYPEGTLRAMAQVKAAFDPGGRLNAGKVIGELPTGVSTGATRG